MTILTKQFDFKNVDWTIAAGGEARDGDTAVLLGDVSGEVKAAFLYWGELNFSGSSDGRIVFDGNSIDGQRLGTSVDTCWGSDHSIGYFADVSDFVTANGTFSISGMGLGGQGASLVVLYDDRDVTNNRDVTLFAGNDSTNQAGEKTTINLGNIDYTEGDVNITLSVGDGQSFTDGSLEFNGQVIGNNLFPGSTGQLRSVASDSLWDVVQRDITDKLSEGSNSARLVHTAENDCLQFVSAIVDKPSQPPVLFLDFDTSIPIDFQVKNKSFLGFELKGEVVGEANGSEPLGVFSDTEKVQLVALVQKTFDEAGIALEVTLERPESGDYHTVRYSSETYVYDNDGDGIDDVRLQGRAYEGVDRFNGNENDIVAVFMDTSEDPLSAIAETTVHEAAHAFGGVHIVSGLEALEDSPQQIEDPAVLAKGFSEHNPAYHYRRFVVEESEEQLALEGLSPGDWDRGRIDNFLYKIGFGDLSQPLTSVHLLVPGATDQFDEESGEPVEALVLLGQNVVEGQELLFEIPEGTPFKIVVATDDPDELNAAIAFNPQASDPFTIIAENSGEIGGDLLAGVTEEELEKVTTTTLTLEDVRPVGEGVDEVPELNVSIDKTVVSESGDSATVTVDRGDDIEGDLEILLASNDTSEVLVPNEIVIQDGQSSVEVALDTLDDFLQDGTQTVTITALAEGFRNGTSTIDVLDDETPALLVTIDPVEISETGGEALATVTRTSNMLSDLEVSLVLSDQSEAQVAETVTILAGETTASIVVSATDDEEVDGDQLVSLTASATGFQSGTGSLTIVDDDVDVMLPIYDIFAAPQSIPEGDVGTTEVTFTVTRTVALAASVVMLAQSGTTGDTDFEAIDIPIEFAIGETSKSFSVLVVGDTEVEPDETITFSIASVSEPATLGASSSTVVVLNDDEAPIPNTDPVAVDDDGFSTAAGSALEIAAADLLDNDSDADGDTLSVSTVTELVGGTVELVDGVIKFSPELGFEGEASFGYSVDDGASGTANATVTVTVTPNAVSSELFQYTAVDTDTNAELFQFVSGEMLAFDTDTPASMRGISVSYTGDGDATDDDGSIGFTLLDSDGNELHRQFERAQPFAVFGDKFGDYLAPDQPLEAGTYELQVTAYSENSRRSEVIASETISFVIEGDIEEPTDSAFLLSFVDTQSNETVQEFADGDVVLFDADTPVSERGIAVSYIADGDATNDDGSIAFALLDSSGNELHSQFERAQPFAVFGDRFGDYSDPDSPLDAGEYELEITAYSGDSRRSDVLAIERVSFSIQDDLSLAEAIDDFVFI